MFFDAGPGDGGGGPRYTIVWRFRCGWSVFGAAEGDACLSLDRSDADMRVAGLNAKFGTWIIYEIKRL